MLGRRASCSFIDPREIGLLDYFAFLLHSMGLRMGRTGQSLDSRLGLELEYLELGPQFSCSYPSVCPLQSSLVLALGMEGSKRCLGCKSRYQGLVASRSDLYQKNPPAMRPRHGFPGRGHMGMDFELGDLLLTCSCFSTLFASLESSISLPYP